MDSYFHGPAAKRQHQRDCEMPTVAGAFDFASFSQLANHQAMSKQVALAGAVQDYFDDRWKDRQSNNVFQGNSASSTSRMLYNNVPSHLLSGAQSSLPSDLEIVAAAHAASRNFSLPNNDLVSLPHNTSPKLDDHVPELNAHDLDNSVAQFSNNPHQMLQHDLNNIVQSPMQDTHHMLSSSASSSENGEENFNTQIVQAFLWIEAKLCAKLKCLQFGERVAYVYNPLEYASDPHAHYISTYCGTKTVLFLGMNPGPFGMAQNGVPFGDTRYVREWLKISGNVNQPPNEHPRRIIQGLECTRSEVSGARFWGFMAKICGSPEQFFKNCFVHNYCPLIFLTKTGKNIIPPALPASERRGLESVCDDALLQCIRVIRAQIIVAVGKYAADRALAVLQSSGDESSASIRVERILHPSPASPQANSGWEEVVARQLQECGVMQYLQSPG